MSADGFRALLALLDGEPAEHAAVLARAVELAESEHARLTLAKTQDVSWLSRCVCVYPIAVVPPTLDAAEHARDVLARTAELIPQSISLTTVLLGEHACPSLRRELERASYDLVIVADGLMRRRRRLRRLLHRCGISVLAVATPPPGDDGRTGTGVRRPAARA